MLHLDQSGTGRFVLTNFQKIHHKKVSFVGCEDYFQNQEEVANFDIEDDIIEGVQRAEEDTDEFTDACQ